MTHCDTLVDFERKKNDFSNHFGDSFLPFGARFFQRHWSFSTMQQFNFAHPFPERMRYPWWLFSRLWIRWRLSRARCLNVLWTEFKPYSYREDSKLRGITPGTFVCYVKVWSSTLPVYAFVHSGSLGFAVGCKKVAIFIVWFSSTVARVLSS